MYYAGIRVFGKRTSRFLYFDKQKNVNMGNTDEPTRRSVSSHSNARGASQTSLGVANFAAGARGADPQALPLRSSSIKFHEDEKRGRLFFFSLRQLHQVALFTTGSLHWPLLIKRRPQR